MQFVEDCCENSCRHPGVEQRQDNDCTAVPKVGNRVTGSFSFPHYPDNSEVNCSTCELAADPYNSRKVSAVV